MSKALVALAVAKRVKDGDIIGLGSGSTAELAVQEIAKRIANEKIRVAGVPTSHRIALCAQEAGISVLSPFTSGKLSWAFDGADEVDPSFNLIKGNGGAMLSEKIVCKRAGVDGFVVIVSEDKLVEKLGTKFPVPVEIVPEAQSLVEEGLKTLGAKEIVLRDSKTKYGPTVTEHNNFILDVRFETIGPELEHRIKCITGVVESGLFVGTTNEVLIAKKDGVWSRSIADGKAKETLVEPA